jgi:hypothetical protein
VASKFKPASRRNATGLPKFTRVNAGALTTAQARALLADTALYAVLQAECSETKKPFVAVFRLNGRDQQWHFRCVAEVAPNVRLATTADFSIGDLPVSAAHCAHCASPLIARACRFEASALICRRGPSLFDEVFRDCPGHCVGN